MSRPQIFPSSILLTVALAFPHSALVRAAVRDGSINIAATQLRAGTSLDLTGKWLYRPGYAFQSADKPERNATADCVRVPVPQLLNRIH